MKDKKSLLLRLISSLMLCFHWSCNCDCDDDDDEEEEQRLRSTKIEHTIDHHQFVIATHASKSRDHNKS